MDELDSLEQEMGNWRPRKPSERLQRQLFRRAEEAPARRRRTEHWNWLTPAAACALTILVAVGSANYRDRSAVAEGEGPVLAGMRLNAGWSNLPQRVVLSEMDENVQWNVCPKLAPVAEAQIGHSPSTSQSPRTAATNLNRSL
jgi:hypothetical protein